MKVTSLPQTFRTACVLGVAVISATFLHSLSAKPIPDNIDLGLQKLVESNLALKASAAKGQIAAGQFNGYATEEAASYAEAAVTEPDSGRVVVDITLRGHAKFDDTLAQVAAKVPSFSVIATDTQYRGVGIIEGWVSVDEVPALANLSDVRGVFLSIKPTPDSTNAVDPTAYMPSRNVQSLRKIAAPEVNP